MLDSQERSADIGVVCLLPQLKWNFPERVGVGFIGDAGVGDKDVDGPMLLLRFCYAGLYRVFGRDVACYCEEIW